MNSQLLLLLALRAIRKRTSNVPLSAINSVNNAIDGGIKHGTLNTVIGGTKSNKTMVSATNAMHLLQALVNSGLKSFEIYEQMKELNLLTSEVLTELVNISTKELDSMRSSTNDIKNEIHKKVGKIYIDPANFDQVTIPNEEDDDYDPVSLSKIENNIIDFIRHIDVQKPQDSYYMKQKVLWGLFAKAILLSGERDSELQESLIDIVQFLKGDTKTLYLPDKILSNFDDYISYLINFDMNETWFDYDEDDGEFIIWDQYRDDMLVYFEQFLKSLSKRYSSNSYMNKFIGYIESKMGE